MGMNVVGRSTELRFLFDQLAHVRTGRLRLVVVTGEPGIGKTTLLRAFLDRLTDDRVLVTSGDRSESGVKFGLLDQFIECAGRIGARSAPRLSVDSILRLSVEEPPTGPFRPRDGSRPGDVSDETARAGASLLGLVRDLLGDPRDQQGRRDGRDHPDRLDEPDGRALVLVVDDAQWVDEPSQQALAFALRRLRTDPVLCVIVTSGAASELSEGLHHLVTELASTLRVSGLDPEELRDLAATVGVDDISPWAASRIHDLTGGNARHARALLETISTRTLDSDADPLPAPAGFGQEVRTRLADQPEEVGELVNAAAVLGMSCRLADAAAIAGLDDPAAPLEEALAAEILAETITAVDRLVVFCHPLVRSAVYHDIGPARRSELHQRAAAQVDDPRCRLWHRIAAAVVPDETLAGEVEDTSRRLAGLGRWPAAADHLLAAARLSPSRTERERRFTEGLDYLLWGGELEHAASLLSDLSAVLDLPRSGYLHGRLAMLRGALPDASTHLHRAWQGTDTRARPGLARAVAEQLALCCYSAGNVVAAADWGQRGRALGTPPVGAPSSLLDISISALLDAGRTQEARRLADTASVLTFDPAQTMPGVADSTGTPSTASDGSVHPDGLVGRGNVLLADDELPAAREAFACAVAISLHQERTIPAGLSALMQLANVEYWTGGWDEAIADAEQAIALAARAGQGWLLPFCHAVLTCPLAGRGSSDAEEHLDRAARHRSAAVPYAEAMIMRARARLAHAAGDADFVVASLANHRTEGRREPAEPRWMLWRPLYAEALAQTGQPDEAEVVLWPFEVAARKRRRRSAQMLAHRSRAAIDVARGRADDAEAGYLAALDLVAGLPMPFEHALLELEYGTFLGGRSRASAAGDLIETARTRFVALAAEPYIARCDQRLARCGRISRVLGVLTNQEIRVVQLVAGGRSNKEVARELVLSVKTIEFHLGNVYAKLGLRSRRELSDTLRADHAVDAELLVDPLVRRPPVPSVR